MEGVVSQCDRIRSIGQSLNSWSSGKFSQSAVVIAFIKQVFFGHDSDVRATNEQLSVSSAQLLFIILSCVFYPQEGRS